MILSLGSERRSVGAIGGMDAAKEGIQAMVDGRYAGKIIIFPQFLDLPPLPPIGLDDLYQIHPDIAEKIEPGNMWTTEAEEALFEKYRKE